MITTAVTLGRSPDNRYYNHFQTLSQNEAKKTSYFRAGKDSWFLFINMCITGAGIVCVTMAIIIASMTMFTQNHQRLVYETTTFLTTTDKNTQDSWQVLTQTLNKNPVFTTTTDVVFDHYFDCWFAAGIKTSVCTNTSVSDYKQCITNNFASTLSTCGSTTYEQKIVSPSLNQYVKCINTALLPSRQSLNGLEICLRTHPWPLYEAPQDIDSEYWLGSFNWMTLLTLGFLFFGAFALYTGDFVFFYENTIGDDDKKWNLNGWVALTVTVASLTVAFLPAIYTFINAYRLPDQSTFGSTYPYPNSVATNNIIVPTAVFVTAYFFAIIVQYMIKMGGPHVRKLFPAKTQITANGMLNAGYTAKQEAESKERVIGNLPVLTTTWADAYLLDIVMFMGVVGSTMQVSTVSVYQLFVAVSIYRLANTSLVRFLYEGYIYKFNERKHERGGARGDESQAPLLAKEQSVESAELYCVRQQAVFMHLATLMALATFATVLYNSNLMFYEFSLIHAVFWTWFAIPEALRMLAHVAVAMGALDSKQNKYLPSENYLVLTYYFTWIWDVAVRIILISVIVWGSKETNGSATFWDTRLLNVTQTIEYMSAY